MLIIDTLPPGNYRVDKFIFKTVGSGNFTYGQNVAPRNDKFKLEWGRITVFSKSLNVRIFNKIPGRGGENSYSFNLYPVTREQEDAILVTIKTLPNFEAWHHTLDDEAAVKWYKQAAEQGHASAQFNLGEMYFKGQGVTQDYTRAYMWWEIAASQGDEKAVKKSEKNQELLIPSQLEKVQLLARECVASNYKNC
ncbi:MAG: sel1 repeat family protein [Gammaproteobacteria bacterium]|nr:sel1 repeat family protein [Gammaproteobacteria bacterium]